MCPLNPVSMQPSAHTHRHMRTHTFPETPDLLNAIHSHSGDPQMSQFIPGSHVWSANPYSAVIQWSPSFLLPLGQVSTALCPQGYVGSPCSPPRHRRVAPLTATRRLLPRALENPVSGPINSPFFETRFPWKAKQGQRNESLWVSGQGVARARGVFQVKNILEVKF